MKTPNSSISNPEPVKSETVDTLEKVAIDLANWSRKYPRDRTYHVSKMSMDDELIVLEERAKKLCTPTPEPEK